MILNENQLNIQKNSMFLSKNNNKILIEDHNIIEMIRLHSVKLSKFISNCAYFVKSNNAREKFKACKLTGNIAEIKELLEPDCVQGFILAGKDSCKIVLFPFLAEYFSNKTITDKEKEAKVKQLKNDFKEASRITEEEFDQNLKKFNEQGVKFFKENINEIIKPYKL